MNAAVHSGHDVHEHRARCPVEGLARATAIGAVWLPEACRQILLVDTVTERIFRLCRTAGMQGAARCGDLVTQTGHAIIDSVRVDLRRDGDRIQVEATVSGCRHTAVDSAALGAVTAACLGLYDQLKEAGRDLRIEDIELWAHDDD